MLSDCRLHGDMLTAASSVEPRILLRSGFRGFQVRKNLYAQALSCFNSDS